MSKHVWIGVDVGKSSFWAAVADEAEELEQWSELPAREFNHCADGLDRFVEWVGGQGIGAADVAGICLESTGRLSGKWVAHLDGRLGSVSIVNPALPDAFRKSLGIRETNDRVDSCVLALFGKTTSPRPTALLSASRQQLRELFRLHQSLEAQCLANQQRLADGPSTTFVRATLKKTIKGLQRQLERLEEEMERIIAADCTLSEDARRMQTIPGIGRKAARVILAEFRDLREYGRNELVALAGLFPREHTSGTSVRKKPRLANGGGGAVRKTLYMCAMCSKRHNPRMREFAQRLEANGKLPIQAIGAMMRKLLLIIRALIVTGQDYDPQHVL